MSVLLAFAIGFGLTFSGQAATPPLQSATQLDDVMIDGRAVDEASRDFVRLVGDRPPRGMLAGRWTKPLCISVGNLNAPFAQQVIDGVARRAVEVGLEVGDPGCSMNVLIVGTDNGPRMAEELVRIGRRRFRSPVNHAQKDLMALDVFRTSEAPVRWWHITYPRGTEDGGVAARGIGVQVPDSDANDIKPTGSAIPTVPVRNPSLIAPTVRYDLETVTVVIDFSKTEDIPLPALIDYTAMVVLTQVDPQADFGGQSSILSLFDDPSGHVGLTDWDRDYLQAVYSAELTRSTPAGQEATIARALAERRRERQAASDGGGA